MKELNTTDNQPSEQRRLRGSTEAYHYYVRLLGTAPFTPDLLKNLILGDHAIELKRAAILWGKALFKGDYAAFDRLVLITDGPLENEPAV